MIGASLQAELRNALARLFVRAWRLHLQTPGVLATVPLLRGVWGAALHEMDPELYQVLFAGGPSGTPGYVLRPAPAGVEPAPALEMILFGRTNRAEEESVWSAWDLALSKGLGPARVPARLIEVRPLAWDGTALVPAQVQPGFPLSPLPWPTGDASAPCRLSFSAPLRLLRRGQLILHPTLADLTATALRRVQALAPEALDPDRLQPREWVEASRSLPARPWTGGPLDLVRYSGRQRCEVEMRGVAGELHLPAGPGFLVDLLAALPWIHLGKGTVMGMGQLVILPQW